MESLGEAGSPRPERASAHRWVPFQARMYTYVHTYN